MILTAKAKIKQTDITRFLKGAQNAGMFVQTIEIVSDGTIRMNVQSPHSDNVEGYTGWEDA